MKDDKEECLKENDVILCTTILRKIVIWEDLETPYAETHVKNSFHSVPVCLCRINQILLLHYVAS